MRHREEHSMGPGGADKRSVREQRRLGGLLSPHPALPSVRPAIPPPATT
jgi:hypothetical protein